MSETNRCPKCGFQMALYNGKPECFNCFMQNERGRVLNQKPKCPNCGERIIIIIRKPFFLHDKSVYCPNCETWVLLEVEP
jgi:DNA-directed RNA polymerase subunit RPC12/RpoP